MQTPTEHKAFVLLLAIVSIAFFWLILPRYGAIFWAIVLAVLFNPMNVALTRKLGGRRNTASLISVAVCIFIVIIPMSLILGALIQEGASMYVRVSSGDIDFNAYLARFQQAIPPYISEWLHSKHLGDLSELRERLSSAAVQSSQIFARRALSFGQNTLDFIISLGIMLYLLFFLFRDGDRLGALIRSTIPLNAAYTDKLLAKFTAVVRATVKGNVIIAVIQGAIGGVTFWFLGIEASLLWGVLMAFLSLLPAIGAAIVWAPVAAYLLLVGDYISGSVLLFVGIVIIGMTDNVLRPPLVGKETKLPDYVVLISTVGGLSLFGINGFVMGPLIAAFFISAWALFGAEQQEEAARQ
ncbi:AI-2E family transporter [Carnimonas bestiolae]|uniref:AI-2E family transporter n=1 Tax=Carnimonas bestiolae TaxID=3402172 RepID=UPI003EDC8136